VNEHSTFNFAFRFREQELRVVHLPPETAAWWLWQQMGSLHPEPVRPLAVDPVLHGESQAGWRREEAARRWWRPKGRRRRQHFGLERRKKRSAYRAGLRC